MAYNHGNSIIIVEAQNWTVKKTLTDEKVKTKRIFGLNEYLYLL